MTWHSSARATPGGLYQSLPAMAAVTTVVVVPKVPFGKEYGNKRIVCLNTLIAEQQALFNGQTAFLKALVTNGYPNPPAAAFKWFLVTASEVRYPIDTTDAPGQAILMIEEGERIEVDITPTTSPKIDLFAQWLDVQGPVKFSRVILTDLFQEIIPAPDPGKSHTPFLSLFTQDVANFSYTLASAAAVSTTIDVARAKNGIAGATQAMVGACTPALFAPIGPTMGGTIKPALSVGESVVAKLSAAAVGDHILVVPYLVTTNS